MFQSRAILALSLIACTAPALATEARFEVRYGPFRPAEVTLSATGDAQSYAVEGHVASSGVVGLLRAFHFDLRAEGARDGDSLVPGRFAGDLDTGRRQHRVTMTYDAGVPRIEAIAPEEPPTGWTLDPATQGGTLDPVSALFLLAHAQPDVPCDRVIDLFDGRRRARLQLEPARANARAAQCDGAYQRVAGYAPEELRDYRALPFTLTYRRDDDGLWQLTRIVTQTPYGRMRINRE